MKPLLLYMLLISVNAAAQQPEPKELLTKSIAAIKNHQSVEYKAAMRMKFLDDDDTSHRTGTVYLKRVPADTVFGGKVWFSTNDTFYKFYDLHHIYSTDNGKKQVMKFDPHKGEQWAITGNITYRVVWEDFLDSKNTEERIANAKRVEYLDDTTVNGRPCYKVLLQAPDEEEFTERIRIYSIDKQNYMPLLFQAQVKYQGNYQYNELYFISYTWDKVPDSRFDAKQIPAGYKTEVYQRKEEHYEPLTNGSLAPLITGKNYKADMKQDTVLLEGKITVLDFWYMACFPCIQAIPEMEKLKKKYEGDSRVQIIGINSYDADNSKLKRLPQFLEHNPIAYSIFLVDKKLPELYRVKAWPTFYIIDTNGEIAYADIGFDDKLYTNLSGEIDKLLGK